MNLKTQALSAIAIASLATSSSIPRAADIVGGSNADISNYPWSVSISRDGIYLCGGAIIGPNIILTAAHCLYHNRIPPPRPEDITVRSGSAFTGSGGQVNVVDSWSYYPDYDNQTQAWDVAVIWLTQDLAWNEQTGPVALVDEGSWPWPRTPATIAGWGLVDGVGLDYPDQLTSVDLPVMNYFDCGRLWLGKSPMYGDVFCAGSASGDKGACSGDNGSALINKNTKKMIGIVASRGGCVGQGRPSLFTDVSKVRSWIREATRV